MNGLLLQPMLDHLFDSGIMTFNVNGAVMFSPMLSQDDIQKLGLAGDLKLRKMSAEMMSYMKYHRKNVFKMTSKIYSDAICTEFRLRYAVLR